MSLGRVEDGLPGGERVTKPFFDDPILNSPYGVPTRHHALDAEGQPLDQPPVEQRRRSSLITPVPKAKKQKTKSKQTEFAFRDSLGLSTETQAYDPCRSSTRYAATSPPGAL